jgi:hypothetical protein
VRVDAFYCVKRQTAFLGAHLHMVVAKIQDSH